MESIKQLKIPFDDKKIDGIFVEINNELINITDLSKEEYEEFLVLVNNLKLIYGIINENKK
jgi:hypothetical protein